MSTITTKSQRTLSETQTVASGATQAFNVSKNSVIEIWGEVPQAGAEEVPTGTVDPTSVSTLEANLINGVLTDLCYNNALAGSVNKELPGINLGSAKNIGSVKIYGWNPSYYPSSFEIEYSDNGLAWNTAGTFNGTYPGTGIAQEVFFPNVTSQYWRLLCLVSPDPTWCVIAEMEAFAPSLGTTPVIASELDLSIIENPSGQTEITNNTSVSLPITIYYNA